MPAAVKPKDTGRKLTVDAVRHEEFCLPRPENEEPRMEGFVAYADDVESGRSRPAMFVTRCLECGAAKYEPHDPNA